MKLFRLLSASLLASFVGVASAQVNLTEGKEYIKLDKPQAVESGNKIEVLEFFSYGCPHCRDLEPHISAWQKSMPGDAQFRRVPVAFHAQWKGFSKAFYAMEALGEVEKMSQGFFDAVHGEGKKLNDADAFYAWAATKGIDQAKLKSAYEGFAVDSKLRRADQLGKAFAIDSVPMVIVDGKYKTAPSMLKNGHVGIPDAINFLVAKAKKERK